MIPILVYHRIADVPQGEDPRGHAMPPARFERQMQQLQAAGYVGVGLDEALGEGDVQSPRTASNRQDAAGAGRGESRTAPTQGWPTAGDTPRKRIAITFDDGYRDIYNNAWPILRRYGFTATVFLVAGRMGGFVDWPQPAQVSPAPLLSWGQVREMDQAGVRFGSHTVTHPRLTTLDDGQAAGEIARSKAIIEDELGHEITLLAYPYGASDERIRRLVAKSGYLGACGMDRGPWSLLNLWRAECLRGDGPLRFGWKARGWSLPFVWLRESSALGQALRRRGRRIAGESAPSGHRTSSERAT